MNDYICFYDGKRIEVQAEDKFLATVQAMQQFKPSAATRHTVTVTLAEKYDGNCYIPIVVERATDV